ncbi:MAG TPA: flagellar biosynthetic protein FliR [Solirubrobacteraceae bacterium]|jgi:flagellar biosynthetic protein FliR|nr:flagellar biosynthetic protein FliR [Solirubrobacteraceae bacterium]
MDQASLSTLVNAIGGAKVTGFFLVLARISPLFVLAPLFSSKMMPAKVKTVVAVGLAMGLTPIAVRGQAIPTDPMSVTALLVEQFLVGLAFAFAVGAVLSAIEAAGALADMGAGFSFGSLVDPVNGNQGGTLTNLYSLVGLAMFIAIGGDAWVLRGMARTFTLVPLTKSAPIASLTSGVEQAFGSIFIAAVEVAAPVILAMLVTDIAFGMVSKVVPQLNVFAVGFALKVGVAMLIVAAALPFISGFMSDQLSTAVTTALHTI